jgi:exodeoxyribonuclease III
VPVVLAGDYNFMPTDLDVYKPERWADDALFGPEVRQAYAALLAQDWTDAVRHLHPKSASIPFGNIGGTCSSAMPGCGSTISCSARP